MQLDENGIYYADQKQHISYPDHGNSFCFDLEEKSFWFNHRNEIIGEIIKKYPYSGNFADIGGGNGYQAAFIESKFPEKEVFLIEPGYTGCLNAKKYGLKNIYNCFSNDFDFTGHNIGGIGLFDVIEHIEDDVNFLKTLSDSVAKGTMIYFTVPAYQFLWSETDDSSGHFRRFNTKMVKELAKKSGLKFVYSSYFMFYLTLPIFFLLALPYKFRAARNEAEMMKAEEKNHNQTALTKVVLNLLNYLELKVLRNFNRVFSGGSIIFVLQTDQTKYFL